MLSVASRKKKAGGVWADARLVVVAVASFSLEVLILQVAGLFAVMLGTAPRKQEVRRYVMQALLQSCLLISTSGPPG